jgi:hypothetical protein
MFCKTNVTIGIHCIIVDCDYVLVCVSIVLCDDVLFRNAAASLESTYVISCDRFRDMDGLFRCSCKRGCVKIVLKCCPLSNRLPE